MIEKNNIHPIDATKLYRSETFTDMENGEIRALHPMFADGRNDYARPSRFFASVEVAINGVPQRVGFEIEAATLGEACTNFSIAAEKAAREFLAKLEEQRTTRRIIQPASGRVQ